MNLSRRARQRPVVLSISGHDPTGGAGIQADIETAHTLGCRACTLVTALTTQDSHNVHQVHALPASALAHQLDILCADIPPDVIKLGLLGSTAQIRMLSPMLRQQQVPIVLDPIITAGGGYALADDAITAAMLEHLIPYTTLLTPNHHELMHLSDQNTLPAAAAQLQGLGCQHILLTGTEDNSTGAQVIHTLYSPATPPQKNTCERLPHTYHGSGCTLATACACQIALGENISQAVQQAQAYTWRSLYQADQPGQGQHLPVRYR
ncbi:MAG: hydroxymethylpyrimidine/phosphomethylpyrimidine kinase [Pseudomonadota bacterium]